MPVRLRASRNPAAAPAVKIMIRTRSASRPVASAGSGQTMYKHLLSVGGLTLVSRATGFLRDVALAAILGTGVIADAFVVAFRLPNNFRAIFGEGAFNAAYVPSYSRVLETQGKHEAGRFAGQIFVILLLSQIVLLALALAFTPQMIRLLAPGFESDPVKLDHAITMTRITFPYLLCITLVTLQSGTLNANRRFVAAAFNPIVLNVVMIGFLAVAFLFPDAGVAASVGILVAGVVQLVLTMIAAKRAGVLERIVRPGWSEPVRRFFKALGPAVIGSAGVQIAIFADTIIASVLPTGGPSSLYYAERIYQLPIGVIGIAAGTVLLPEMSRRLAGGDPGGALHAQNRAMALSFALSAPFFVIFLLIPGEIMQGVFVRGSFTREAAAAAGAILAAYGIGMLPVVLIRSAVASFQARGDTTTPMFASLARRRLQRRAQGAALQAVRRGRPRHRYRRRCLDQSRAAGGAGDLAGQHAAGRHAGAGHRRGGPRLPPARHLHPGGGAVHPALRRRDQPAR